MTKLNDASLPERAVTIYFLICLFFSVKRFISNNSFLSKAIATKAGLGFLYMIKYMMQQENFSQSINTFFGNVYALSIHAGLVCCIACELKVSVSMKHLKFLTRTKSYLHDPHLITFFPEKSLTLFWLCTC